MLSKALSPDAAPTPASDRVAKTFVWSMWVIMLLLALTVLVRYGRTVPLTEDWWLVPALTGNEPHPVEWLWYQNNEHRLPLPRLIMLVLLKMTHGDFRIGMLFNITILAALALAMIQAARYLRGGRTIVADAFFPIVLLHLGHWENLLWTWQIAFVLGTVLTCVMLLALVSSPRLTKPSVTIVAGTCLILLPLVGANTLVFVPLLALWLGYCGALHWRGAKSDGEPRWTGSFLIAAAAIALILTGLYFVGYQRPSWTPPNPGLLPSIGATLQFLALSFGPVARSSWILSIFTVLIFLIPGATILIFGLLRHNTQERHRAIGIFLFFSSFAGFALAMGWGRAGAIEILGGWPLRYSLLAAQGLCAIFFIWELYGPPRLRSTIQTGLFVLIFLLIPFNTFHGFWWARWFINGDAPLMHDLAIGAPLSTIAARHGDLLHPRTDAATLTELLHMLRQAEIGPFAPPPNSLPGPKADGAVKVSSAETQPLVTQEIRYHQPVAAEVLLVWGVNGWQSIPEAMRPDGTIMKNVMHTPMAQEGNAFVAKLALPAGTRIDYGFLITKTRTGAAVNVWEADGDQDYHTVASQDNPVEVEAVVPLPQDIDQSETVAASDDDLQEPEEVTTRKQNQEPGSNIAPSLVTQEFRYRLPEAGKVLLVWGVDGWQPVPEEIRPAGTVIKNVMRTPMNQKGDIFVTTVQVPAGAKVDYGFLITDKRGILDIARPVWDEDQSHQTVALKDDIIEVESTLALDNEWSSFIRFWPYFFVGVIILLLVWFSIFFFSDFLT